MTECVAYSYGDVGIPYKMTACIIYESHGAPQYLHKVVYLWSFMKLYSILICEKLVF